MHRLTQYIMDHLSHLWPFGASPICCRSVFYFLRQQWVWKIQQFLGQWSKHVPLLRPNKPGHCFSKCSALPQLLWEMFKMLRDPPYTAHWTDCLPETNNISPGGNPLDHVDSGLGSAINILCHLSHLWWLWYPMLWPQSHTTVCDCTVNAQSNGSMRKHRTQIMKEW